MPSAPLSINDKALSEDGYVIVPRLIGRSWLASFETEVSRFAEREIDRLKLPTRHKDALWDLMVHDSDYRNTLFPLLKYLRCVQRAGVDIGDRLERAGFFDARGFEIPVAWPVLRVDIPNELDYLLPMHQDYRSTVCTRAYRIWIPLRDAGPQTGTLRVVPGSHRAGALPHHNLNDAKLGPGIPETAFDGAKARILSLTAGDAVLFDPLLIHGSVPGSNDRLKFVLLIQLQDLSTLIHPNSEEAAHRASQAEAVEMRMEMERRRAQTDTDAKRSA